MAVKYIAKWWLGIALKGLLLRVVVVAWFAVACCGGVMVHCCVWWCHGVCCAWWSCRCSPLSVGVVSWFTVASGGRVVNSSHFILCTFQCKVTKTLALVTIARYREGGGGANVDQ